jgi:murein DD-endopeptidase
MCTPSARGPFLGRLIVCCGTVLSLAACRGAPPQKAAPATAPAPAATPAVPPPASGSQPASRPAASAPAPAPAAAAQPAPPSSAPGPRDEAPDRAGLKRLRVEVNGPLETAVVGEVGPTLGPRLVQVLVRTLVWWLSVPGDLVRGDLLEALYEERPGQDPLVHAVRYQSQKKDQRHRAYRFKPAGAPGPHFYSPDGDELELRFTHPPLADYEQVTSLVHDGRGHKGVDFKTPVGTPVLAPFEARVARKNWHFKGNGNSLDLREVGGRGVTALFLHLAEPPSVAVGAHVARGQVVARSGNTGRSSAPHLHFQVMQGQKVLDPFTALPAQRHKLPAGDKARFATEVARLDKLLGAR